MLRTARVHHLLLERSHQTGSATAHTINQFLVRPAHLNLPHVAWQQDERRRSSFLCSSSKQEMCPEVDELNTVIRVVPRSVLVKGRLLGRGAYCLVFNQKGELFVSQRSKSKDVWPGCFDTLIAGVVQAGEEYEDTMVRELSEELGISQATAQDGLQLTRLGTFRHQDRYCDVWGCAFTAVLPATDAQGRSLELALQKEEVVSGGFKALEEVQELLKTTDFTPVGRRVLELYLSWKDQGVWLTDKHV